MISLSRRFFVWYLCPFQSLWVILFTGQIWDRYSPACDICGKYLKICGAINHHHVIYHNQFNATIWSIPGQCSAEVDSKIFQVIVVKVCVFGIWSKQHNNLLTFKLFCNVYDGPKNKLNAYSAWWWILLSKQVKKIPDIFFHQGNFDHHVILWDFGCKFRPHQWWSAFSVIHH